VIALADLLDRSGKSRDESRWDALFNLNLDPNQLYFLDYKKNKIFATQLVKFAAADG